MESQTYTHDILSQPESLRCALEKWTSKDLDPVATALRRGRFDRILIAGMGGSLNACYPVWLTMAAAGFPAIWVDAAELIHHVPSLLTPSTLFWMFSQSGKSAEIVAAAELAQTVRPAGLLATVNDPQSPLADVVRSFRGVSAIIPMQAQEEATVSTRTYVNAVAMGLLAAICLLRQDVESARSDLLETAGSMETYLASWQSHLEHLGSLLGFPGRLAILGRGISFASARAGALVLAEAAKFVAVPFQAGEFRHGPLELAGPDLTVLLFEGPSETQELNRRLLNDLRSYSTPAFWIGSDPSDWQVELPRVPSIGLPLVEILPLQLLSIHFARQIGLEPGKFFRTGKVTLVE